MFERLEAQKKLTANQWNIIATANVGDMLDFFDFFGSSLTHMGNASSSLPAIR